MTDSQGNSTALRPALRRLWRWLAGTFAALVILLAVLLGLFRLMLPQVPAYHAQIEAWASQAVGLPVELGRLDARWSFGGPELTFQTARLYARDTRDVLIEAAEGSVGINLGELFRGGKIRPGKVVLVGTRLSLERNEAGILHLTGQAPPSGGAKRAMAPVFQVLPRGDFEFENAAVLYVDRAAGHGPWRFSDVNLGIHYGRSALQIEGSARLPASLGEYAEFKLGTSDPLRDPLAIRWQGSVRLEQIDLEGVGEVLPPGLPDILDGRADAVTNFGMIGREIQHLSTSFSVREFVFGGDETAPEGWTRIGGLFEWSREENGWKAGLTNFVIERAGFVWPETRISAERTVSSNESVEIVYFDAGFLRLEDLRPFAQWLPAGDTLDKLRALEPTGELQQLVINRSLRDGELVSFSVRSDFKDLSVRADGSVPGASGLSGKLRMDDASGLLQLDSGASSLLMPEFFNAPVPMEALRASLSWQKTREGWQLESDAVQLDTGAFSLLADFALLLPDDEGSPVLQLQAEISDLELLAAREFMPEKKIPPGAYRWLYGALVSGSAPATSLSFSGPLRDYPFTEGGGSFRARTIIENMRFAFARDWPAVEGARLEVVLENASYRGRIISGTIAGNDVSGSTATIANLGDPVLVMNGQARGTLADLFSFLRTSPIARALGPRLMDVRGAGGAQTDVVLNLPLTRLDEFRVNGNTALQAEWLGFSGLDQRLTRLSGDLNFTEKTVRANDIKAMLFGRPVNLEIRPGSDASGAITSTLVELNGSHSSTNLVNNLPFPVAVVLDGEADWQAVARLPAPGADSEPFSIDVGSSLSGMAITLPEPAFKAAEESRRFTATLTFPAEGEILMRTSIGSEFSGMSRFRKDAAEWRHERSGLRLGGDPASLPPTEGLAVSGEADVVALDEWIDVDWQTPPEKSSRPPLLRSVNIRTGRLLAYGQVIPDAVVKLDRNAREWLAQVVSERAEGSFLIPVDFADGEPVFADMVRLVLMPESTDGAEVASSDPRDLPSMRITAAEFVYDDMYFGSLEALIEKSANGLRVETLRTQDPGFVIDGSGRWEVVDGSEGCEFDFVLKATDVRRALTQLAFDPVLKATDATVSAQLRWPGPPDRNFRESLSGTVSVSVGDGQLLDVEPGAGRMFGLLSIAALPRRLSLDFRDVFDSGFGFDSISGDFELIEGQAYTNNLVLDGPAADIGIAGRAGLVARDYDQTAVVRANLGSALPVAGAIAGGPAIGAALLIFSEILKDPLKDMSKVFYRVTGSWDDPEIVRVNQAVAEAPAAEAPAPVDDGG